MALSQPGAPPFQDTMKLHLTSDFHQDDLWTACGAYGGGDNGLLNSGDELSNMVSMVNSLQDSHQQHHHEVGLPSGLHRNASFDSGSTSHDSCTASFSTGSPVTVLPPLQYSSCGDGKEQEPSYIQYVDSGLWAAHEQASSDCDQILPSPGGENFSSLFLNEVPLRSYDDGVHQVGGNKDYLDSVVPVSISSHTRYQTSDNSGSTLESSVTGMTFDSSSVTCNKILLGHEHDGLEHNSNLSTRAVSASSAAVPVDSVVSPTGQHRRLSWTDHHWPVSSTSDRMQIPLNSFQSTTSAQNLLLPHQIVNGFKSSTAPSAVLNFQDADYLATCNHYRQTQLRDGINTSGVATNNSLKRSYLAMQSSAGSHNSSPVLAVPPVPAGFASASSQQQEAAALSALLYKNNHGSDLLEKARAGSSCVSGGSASADSTTIQPPPKLRRRHGTATDPQSIAARTRRERFSDRIKLLQCLVPNGERLDTVSMLGHTLEYVRFLQHQVYQLYNGNDEASIPQPDSESREKWKEFMDTTQTIALS